MTVQTEVLSHQFAGNGATVDFDFDFTIFDSSEIRVREIDNATGVAILKTIATHYTVRVNENGGRVTMLTAPAAGKTLDLRCEPDVTQPTSIKNQGNFRQEIHERAFDRRTQHDQYLLRRILRSPHIADYGEPNAVLLIPYDRAGKYLAFDANKEPIASSGTGNDAALRTDLAITTVGSEGGLLVGFRRGEAGSVGRTVNAKLRDRADVRDFGVAIDGSGNQVTAMQAALDAENEIFIPDGIVQIGSTLRFNDNQVLRFQSRNAVLRGAIAGALLKGKGAETTRRYELQMWSGTLDNTSRATAGGIGLDLFATSMAKIFGTKIRNVETSVRQAASGALGCFYNEFHGVDILTVDIGYDNGTLANENKVFGGRITDCEIGTSDNDNSCNTYFGLAIEAFTSIGHRVGNTTAALLTRLIASRLENLPTAGIGVSVGAFAQDTLIESPYFTGLTTDIADSGARTTILMPRGGASTPLLKFGGGQGLFGHFHADVVRDVASLAAGEFRQEGPFTVTGARVGDAVSVALPAAWPTNVMVGIPIVTANDTLYLPMHNPSGGAVDPASGTFSFDIWRH